MTTQEVRLIRKSVTRIIPVANAAVYLFFSKLYELHPELKEFSETMPEEVEQRYFGVLLYLINRLEKSDIPVSLLTHFGSQCKLLGYSRNQLLSLSNAFYWTLEQTLRSAFTDDVQDSWRSFIHDVMTHIENGFNNTDYLNSYPQIMHKKTPGNGNRFCIH